MHLVVKSPFEGYQIGDQITDPDAVKKIGDDHRASFVIRVAGDPPQGNATVTPVEPDTHDGEH